LLCIRNFKRILKRDVIIIIINFTIYNNLKEFLKEGRERYNRDDFFVEFIYSINNCNALFISPNYMKLLNKHVELEEDFILRDIIIKN
jgi:hypothetical protein